MVLSQDAFIPEDMGDVWRHAWLSQLWGVGTTPGIQRIDAKEAAKHPSRTGSPTAKGMQPTVSVVLKSINPAQTKAPRSELTTNQWAKGPLGEGILKRGPSSNIRFLSGLRCNHEVSALPRDCPSLFSVSFFLHSTRHYLISNICVRLTCDLLRICLPWLECKLQ